MTSRLIGRGVGELLGDYRDAASRAAALALQPAAADRLAAYCHFAEKQQHRIGPMPDALIPVAFSEPLDSPVRRAAAACFPGRDLGRPWLRRTHCPATDPSPALLATIRVGPPEPNQKFFERHSRMYFLRPAPGVRSPSDRWQLYDLTRLSQVHEFDWSHLRDWSGLRGWSKPSVVGGRIIFERLGTQGPFLSVWDAESGNCLQDLSAGPGVATAVAVTPDTKLAVSGSLDGTVQVWDLVTGQSLHILTGHERAVVAVEVTAAGKTAISASTSDGPEAMDVRVWDLVTGQCLQNFNWVKRRRLKLVTTDGRWAVVEEDEYPWTTEVWDLRSGRCLRTFNRCDTLGPDGTVLFRNHDDAVHAWDPAASERTCALEGCFGYVAAGAVTPDGRKAVLAVRHDSPGWTLAAYDLTSGRRLHSLGSQTSGTSHVSVNLVADGSMAVSVPHESYDASVAEDVRVWDLATGECRCAFVGMNDVHVTADGRRAASHAQDGTLRVWDLARLGGQRTLQVRTGDATALTATADGRSAVSGSGDGTLRVWDLTAEEGVHFLGKHADRVGAVAAGAAGRLAVSGSDNQEIRVWDLATGGGILTLDGHTDVPCALAVTPDDGRFVAGYEDRTLRVWDLVTGECSHVVECHSQVGAVAANSRQAVVGFGDGMLRVLDLASGNYLNTLDGHGGAVCAIAVTADGHWAVSGAEDKTVRVWNLATAECVRTLGGHADRILAVGIAADGRRAVSVADYYLRVWNVADGECFHLLYGGRIIAAAATGTRAVSWSEGDDFLRVWKLDRGERSRNVEGEVDYSYHSQLSVPVKLIGIGPWPRILSTSDGGHVQVWDADSGSCIGDLSVPEPAACGVVMTTAGRTGVGSDDGALRVCDPDLGAWRLILGGRAPMEKLALLADGRRAVSLSDGGALRVWDLERKACRRTWYVANTLAVTGDAQAISGADDGSLRVWDLDNGMCTGELRGHTATIHSVAPTADGRRAVSASDDGALRVWDLANRRCLHTLRCDPGPIGAVAIAGRWVACGAEDGVVRVWDLDTEACLASFPCEAGVLDIAMTAHSPPAIVARLADGQIQVFRLEGL